MCSEGHVVQNNKGQYILPAIGREITGRIKIHPRGFGFIIPDVPNREGDLFVPAGNTNVAPARGKALMDFTLPGKP